MSQDYKNCLLKSLSHLSENPIFFDVGCNINPIVECNNAEWIENWNDDFTEIVLQNVPSAKCYGVEPIHYQTYEKKWSSDPRVQLFVIGLSDKNSTETFYYPGDRHVLTSFYQLDEFNKHGETINKVDIECRTIDSLCTEHNINLIDYLKIDTEGAEFKILKGSENMIQNSRIKFIQFEYGLVDDEIADVNTISNFLKFYGYNEVLTSGREKLWERI
jgi:FkbM family methyltransferase